MTRLVLVAGITAACAVGGSAREAPAAARACEAPTLTIVSPRPGSTVAAPFRVHYRVACFRVGARGGHLHAYLTPRRHGIRFEFRLPRAETTVLFPDHPMVSGRRLVLFELARRSHSPVRASTARVVVPLTIEGSRTP